MPNSTPAAVTTAHSFFPCNPEHAALFSVNPGVSAVDAIDQALCFMTSARTIGMQVCSLLEQVCDQPEHEQGTVLIYPMLDLMKLAEGIMNAVDDGMSARAQCHDMRFPSVIERVGELLDGEALIVNPAANDLAAKDAAELVAWVRAQRQGGAA